MNDRDLLDLIARDAPAPRPGLTGEVLRAARRTRARRRAATLAAIVGTTTAGVAAATALAASVSPGRTPAPPALPGPSAGPAAALYATAIKEIIGQDMTGNPSGSRPPVLYVLDHTCTGVAASPPPLTCAGPPLGPALRRDLTAALRGYAPVDFVPSQKQTTGNDPALTVRNHGVQVVLGPIRLSSRHAEVPLAIRRTALDGRGLTYQLSNHGGRWAVDRLIGGGWIS